ncbi:amidohydrolase [Russula ochroleuca]|uniref:Amidohydrolase n=1 Tax=Russula ochroleuca TaxID=152965 RepID=A0A9P5MV42_9AGAM|nr:amidohydrolase [Russula ochroleuca]
MSSNLSHEWSGCFSGLLAGSRRQRSCQSVPLQEESAAPLAPQESSHGKTLPGEFREGGLPPPYSWTTSEKDHIPDVMKTIEDTIHGLDHELRQLSLDIHDHPELGFEERYAHDRLTEFMSSRGFTVTRQYLGLATAWRAEFRRGARGLGRIVGVNAEMDALPGIGHACGHNLIAMAGVAIALALRAALEKHDVPGTVVLLGTPAEESGAGKQILLERGAYKDMDVCIMCHPVAGDTLELGFISSLALQTLSVEYFGQPAHAGYAPWDGVNALDAAFVAYAGISALRQQIRPEQRVHGVISGRDWTPNVIPDYAKMSWSVRADAWGAVEPLRERVMNCLESGASATGCRHQVVLGERYLDLRQNPVLAEDMALAAQRCYGIPSYWTEQPASASTDFVPLPALHPIFNIPTPDDAKNHTRGFAQGARTEAAHTAALRTAALLARTGFRVHADAAFCARVRAAYEAGGAKVGGAP